MCRHLLLAALLAGCIHGTPPGAVSGAVLGRVVIYRNGVAFYERRATVENGRLSIHVPREAVDDFLKSLIVVDPATGKPLSISIPRKEASDGSTLTLTLETPDRRRTDVLLTYVTESPAWKPSYRVVVGPDGKVMFEGWAIVDNVSSEDWKGVLVGVGASSAMAFRYDLWSVRRVDRDLLQGDDKFAVAPPTGVSPYTEHGGGEELGSLDAGEVRADASGTSFAGTTSLENQYFVDGVATTSTAGGPTGQVHGVVTDKKSGERLAGVTVTAGAGNTYQTAITDENGAYTIPALPAGAYTLTFYYADVTNEQKDVRVAAASTAQVSPTLDTSRTQGEVIHVEATAPMIDPTSMSTGETIVHPGRSFQGELGAAAGTTADHEPDRPPAPTVAQGDAKIRAMAQKIAGTPNDVVIEARGATEIEATNSAAAVRNKLIDDGVPAKRIHVVPQVGAGTGLRVLAVAPGTVKELPAAPRGPTSDAPVGETHFLAERPMDVPAGTSAMVAMVHAQTTGGVVYLYDPVSDRGDARFAFKAVKLDNPTNDTLEPGPMTVYGDGRFVGEGITEAVPPHASAVVPFASDRQIAVSQHGSDEDRIAKLETVQRGVITAELQRRRTTHFTLSSRLDQPATVFLRHRLESGWTLVDAPPRALKVGDSSLFEVDVPAKETVDVAISESAPMERTLELSNDSALDLMKVYLDEPDASPALKSQLQTLLATHRVAADLVDKIATMREQLGEYKSRSGELHAQLVTLKAVRTGGDLMSGLRAKLLETSEKVQKLTIGIVDAEEQLMLTRVKFGNQLADLHLSDATVSRR